MLLVCCWVYFGVMMSFVFEFFVLFDVLYFGYFFCFNDIFIFYVLYVGLV